MSKQHLISIKGIILSFFFLESYLQKQIEREQILYIKLVDNKIRPIIIGEYIIVAPKGHTNF